MDRRTLLGYTAALSTGLLAGCTGGGGSTPTVTDPPTDSPTPEPTPTATEPSGPAQVVDVGPGGQLQFDPESFTIATGETVRWVFRSSGHNVKVDSAPAGAEWTGTPGEQFDTLEVGETHEHTFTIAGEYDYFCAPHRSAGMVASFTVEG